MIVKKCEKLLCHAPEIECDEGHLLFESCPHFKVDSLQQGSSRDVHQQVTLFSWTGLTLGMDDVAKLAVRSRVVSVALVGASDTGKTSFLATLYLLLLNGYTLDGYKFAGSLTLSGWEILASRMRWSGTAPPSFPDHTPRGTARQPGLLHLALRDRSDRLCDVVFADAPGEWFERWAIDRLDSQSEGARWLEQHADSVAVFLDSERLSSAEHCGVARSQSLQLLSRSFDSYSDCAVGVVWAKYDTFDLNPATTVVKQKIDSYNMQSFNVISANVTLESKGVMETASWLIERALEGRKIGILDVPIEGENQFLNFRGRLE